MVDYMIYNSAEVRRAASQVRRSADTLEGSAVPELRSVRSDLPGNFKGDAADALSQRLYELDGDILKIKGALTKVSRALYAFADEIDKADREVKAGL